MTAADAHAAAKAEATAIALAALNGYELVKLPDGTWMIGRWGLAKPLPTLHAVHEFLKRAAGVAA